MFLQLVFCAVIGVYSVNGQCSEEIGIEILNCIKNSPSFSGQSLEYLLQIYNSPSGALCSDKANVLSLVKCIYDANLKCSDDRIKTLNPTYVQNEKTLNYFCPLLSSYNVTCLENSLADLNTCIYGNLQKSSSLSYDGQKPYICGSRENGKKCIKASTKLDQCPETKETYLEMAKFQNPEACGGEAGFESGVFDDGKSTTTPMDQSESIATSLYQSVVLLTTITLMTFIF